MVFLRLLVEPKVRVVDRWLLLLVLCVGLLLKTQISIVVSLCLRPIVLYQTDHVDEVRVVGVDVAQLYLNQVLDHFLGFIE